MAHHDPPQWIHEKKSVDMTISPAAKGDPAKTAVASGAS